MPSFFGTNSVWVLAITGDYVVRHRETHGGNRRALTTALLAAALMLLVRHATAETLVEQLSVNATQTTPTYATSTLTSGVTYRIEISGVYAYGGGQADAEYVTQDAFVTHSNPGTPGDKDVLVVYGSSIGIPIVNAAQNLTAQDVDWGPFASNHVYSFAVVGDGGTIGFVVSDYWGNSGSCSFNVCLGDNSGTLTVNIFEVPAPTFACVGFESPMHVGAVTVKKNRVLPLKAQLLDGTGHVITDTDLIAPPVIHILFDSGITPAVDVTDQALSAGQGTEGNQFAFSGGTWQFNLQTKHYTAAGTYTITGVSGDASEYTIEPTCTAVFVME